MRFHTNVECIDTQVVKLRVILNENAPSRHKFDIVLALPRPKMLRRILRTIAEYGVENLHLVNSARVEKSYWQSPLLQSTPSTFVLCVVCMTGEI